MKKIFITLAILFNLYIYSQEPVINDLANDTKLYGTKFFPIFIGAEWNWDVKSGANTMTMIWNIVSMHIINDPANNLNNTTGFKVKVLFKHNEKVLEELTGELFLIISDGFITNYEKSDKTYKLEKIIPVDPKIGISWNYGDTKHKITEINENSVKVESSNEVLDKYGYQLFVKNTGPFEIYEYSPKSKEETFITLLKSSSYKTPVEEIQPVKKEEPPKTEKTALKDEPKKDNNSNSEIKKYYVELLSSSKKYIQLGAFNMNYYAEEFVKKLIEQGFSAFIYRDKDAFYKVLIQTDDPDKSKKEIKEKTGLDTFLKK